MSQIDYRLVTAAEDEQLRKEAAQHISKAWPEFMFHDPLAQLLDNCWSDLPEYQFVLRADNGDVIAVANSIPLRWDGQVEDLPDKGWDWALSKGIDDLAAGNEPNLLCALQIVVPHQYKGKRISAEAVRAMKEIGAGKGLAGLIAPVRPSLKCDYPLTPIGRYIRWQVDGDLPFDPWLRVHARLGARIIKPCNEAMTIESSIADWERWTGMRFPESGQYIVPGALLPVEVDVSTDKVSYIEPNVWMFHPPE